MFKSSKVVAFMITILLVLSMIPASMIYAAIPAPTPSAPVNNSIVRLAPVTLRWNNVSGETKYLVTVRNVKTNALIYNETVVAANTTSFTILESKLAEATQYRWVVTSVDSKGVKYISASMYFTTETFVKVYYEGIKQTRTLWCWAANAEMLGKSVKRTSMLTQADVVKYFKATAYSDYPDVSGTGDDCQLASEYVVGKTTTPGPAWLPAYANFDCTATGATPWTVSQMNDMIGKRKYPFSLLLGKYDSNNARQYGHFVFVYSISNIGTIKMHDTIPNETVVATYQEVINGTSSKLNYTKYDGVVFFSNYIF